MIKPHLRGSRTPKMRFPLFKLLARTAEITGHFFDLRYSGYEGYGCHQVSFVFVWLRILQTSYPSFNYLKQQ